MKTASECTTVAEVDELIRDIGRHMPDLLSKAKSRVWTAEERAKSPKLDAMLIALARREEITSTLQAVT